MSYGLTSAGFVAKSLEVILEERRALYRAAFGESIDLGEEGPLGQLIGIESEREAELWDLGSAIYAGHTADGASGAALDDMCAITGTSRDEASKSTLTLTATGIPATVLSIGRVASVEDTEVRFTTTAAGTITLVSAWATGTVYALGDRVRNDSPSKVYQCITAGTSAGSGGPTGTDASITDNTAVWRYLGDGTGAVDIAAEAVETGPKVAASGTLTNIETPVSGWSSVNNVEDADLGSDVEGDTSLHVKRELELRGPGNAAVEAIRAAVLKVPGVTMALVFENPTDTTDGDGIPPHAFEVLVQDGLAADDDNEEVATTIFESKAAGINPFGAHEEDVTDSQGIVHTIGYTRPTEVAIWATVNVTYDSTEYAVSDETALATAIKEEIVEWGDLQKPGKNAVPSAIVAQAFDVDGVIECTATIGTGSPGSGSSTISIGLRELATYDTGRITVVLTPGVP